MDKMPVLFVGHGTPMNAIENNNFTEGWKTMVEDIPQPKAILMISAHWYTDSTRIINDKSPKMIYDMYGFPKELYEIIYPAQNNFEVMDNTVNLLNDYDIETVSRGYDHGVWSVLVKMYPDANIPVCEVSIDGNRSFREYYEIGKKLSYLRKQGVLIIGSGNIVHNLRKANYRLGNTGYEWAYSFDEKVKNMIIENDVKGLINIKDEENASLAIPTSEHYIPLLYVLGATNNDEVTIYNEECTLGSLSMTSYKFE